MRRIRGTGAILPGRVSQVVSDSTSVLVKPEVAARLLRVEEPSPSEELGRETGQVASQARATVPGSVPAAKVGVPALTRFDGTVDLDPTRVGRDAGKIAEEVLQHLAGLVGSTVEVSLEIQAERREGFPDSVVRMVTENAKRLRFKTEGFEEK